MNIEKFKYLVEQVEQVGEEVEFFGSASDKAIQELGERLQVVLDQQICSYLKEFGGGGIIEELHTNGIWDQDAVEDNIYTLEGATLYGRKYYNLPHNYVVISSDFFSGCWVLECSNPLQNPVYNYNCALEKIENKLFDSFEDYLLTQWQGFVDEIQEDF
ncbi:SMI1/KNR4 family protein [Myroides sp. LJL115]